MPKPYFVNGKMYSSRRSYIRQLRGMFANMNTAQRRSFKPVTLSHKSVQKKPARVTGKNWKDVNSTIEKETIIKPIEKNGKVVLQESTQTYRINESTIQDPATGDVQRIVEAEESSRYTPSQLDYHYEELGGGVTQVNATKDKRIVSSTVSTLTPPKEKDQKLYQLESDFTKWDRDKVNERRLSTAELKLLGKELGIPTGGGKLKHYQATMEKRIRSKLALQTLEQKQELDARYRTFPQRTKSKIAKVKGKKLENSDEVNKLIIEALEGKPRHERSNIDEMELLLKNADKKRPDKNYDQTQLQKAIEVEKEHTTDTKTAKIIAKDHLDEDKNYYKKLEKIEPKKLSKEKLKNQAIELQSYSNEFKTATSDRKEYIIKMLQEKYPDLSIDVSQRTEKKYNNETKTYKSVVIKNEQKVPWKYGSRNMQESRLEAARKKAWALYYEKKKTKQ